MPQQNPADDQAEEETEAGGHHEGALGPGAPFSRQHLASHGVEERLGAKGDAGHAEPANDHVEAVGAGHDEGAQRSKKAANHREPLAPPVVSRLGDDGAENNGANGQDGGRPC